MTPDSAVALPALADHGDYLVGGHAEVDAFDIKGEAPEFSGCRTNNRPSLWQILTAPSRSATSSRDARFCLASEYV